MGSSFSFLSSSSNAASKTIMISPTVPNILRIGKKSRLLTPRVSIPIFRTIPKTISIKTDGILVRRDNSLKKNDRIMMAEASMIKLYVDKMSICLIYFNILQE